jgi:hypothetical protein
MQDYSQSKKVATKENATHFLENLENIKLWNSYIFMHFENSINEYNSFHIDSTIEIDFFKHYGNNGGALAIDSAMNSELNKTTEVDSFFNLKTKFLDLVQLERTAILNIDTLYRSLDKKVGTIGNQVDSIFRKMEYIDKLIFDFKKKYGL